MISEIPKDSHRDFILHDIAQSIVDQDSWSSSSIAWSSSNANMALPQAGLVKNASSFLLNELVDYLSTLQTGIRFIREAELLADSRLTRLLQHDNAALPRRRARRNVHDRLTHSVRVE